MTSLQHFIYVYYMHFVLINPEFSFLLLDMCILHSLMLVIVRLGFQNVDYTWLSMVVQWDS